MDRKWLIFFLLSFLVVLILALQFAILPSNEAGTGEHFRFQNILTKSPLRPTRDDDELLWLNSITSNLINVTTAKANTKPPKMKDFRDLPLQYPATKFSDLEKLRQLSRKYANSSQDPLVILLWTKLFHRADWALGAEMGTAPFKKLGCPVHNCFVTDDRTFLENASTVLINFRDDFDYNDRPANRSSKQHWVFFLWESPEHTYHWTWQYNLNSPQYLKNFGHFFNWTMTYRLDSDIPFLYGRFIKKSRADLAPVIKNRLKTKTKSVIWIQSNCDTRSHRTEYIRELQRYIDVEVVGGCLGEPSQLSRSICSRPNVFEPMSKECIAHINENFKFYLATENSLCRDYVTEKFFRGASLNLIPVVFNGADMSLFGPFKSYIETKDYPKPKDLAAALIEIGNDTVKYDSYFWWKQYYDAQNFWDGDAFTRSFCDLCALTTRAKLEPAKYAKTYADINDWWMGKGMCYEGRKTFDDIRR